MTPFQFNTLKQSAFQMMKNRFKNLPIMADSHPINALANRHINFPAIIVGAGPSLDQNINQLANVPKDTIIIACDSALGPLKHAAVGAPNYVASVDYRSNTAEKYMTNGLPVWFSRYQSTNLIFIPEVSPAIPQIGFKNRYFAYHGFSYASVFNEILGINCFIVKQIQSCSNLALWSAMLMGCNPIVLIGHDFGFAKDGRDHATGTVLDWGNSNTEETNEGLQEMLKIEENLISSDPNKARKIINATEGGQDISGTVRMSLQDAMKQFRSRKSVKNNLWYGLNGLRADINQYFNAGSAKSGSVGLKMNQNPYALLLSDFVLIEGGEKLFKLLGDIQRAPNDYDRSRAEKAHGDFLMHMRRKAIVKIEGILDGIL